jgi:L-ascorbate metabolism protein UlaG (beta-lactamase superfamily)
MVLNYFGEGCFRLQSGELSILVNPTSNRLKADVTLKTIAPTDTVSSEEITFAGEYEVKGIEIQGWEIKNESTEKYVKTIFAVTWEDMRFVFLGHISEPLSAEYIEEIGEPDILFVPTGDEHFLAGEAAAKMIKQIEPKIIVPAYYKNASDLVKALGVKPETEEKLVFRKKDIADAKNKFVMLEAKG